MQKLSIIYRKTTTTHWIIRGNTSHLSALLMLYGHGLLWVITENDFFFLSLIILTNVSHAPD